MSVRILLVEDVASFRKTVAHFLRTKGYDVHEAWSLTSAQRLLPSIRPQILLLDLELEDGFSYGLIQQAVGAGIATVMVSSHTEPDERIRALELGADDYMLKPIHLPELLLRIRKLQKRTRQGAEWFVLDFGTLVLDAAERSVTGRSGEAVSLSTSEFRALHLLIKERGSVVSRDVIARYVFGHSLTAHSRGVDVLVGKLRRKLELIADALLVESVRGQGYRFVAPTEGGGYAQTPTGPRHRAD